ncbi:MAG: BrnA antitoxin family protein [Chakrabartia sp.]
MSKQKPVVFDNENPEWTKADFASARAVADFPALAAAFPKARGRPTGSTKPARKEQIALRVDADVLARYKAEGRGWQTRMNEVLRAGVG